MKIRDLGKPIKKIGEKILDFELSNIPSLAKKLVSLFGLILTGSLHFFLNVFLYLDSKLTLKYLSIPIIFFVIGGLFEGEKFLDSNHITSYENRLTQLQKRLSKLEARSSTLRLALGADAYQPFENEHRGVESQVYHYTITPYLPNDDFMDYLETSADLILEHFKATPYILAFWGSSAGVSLGVYLDSSSMVERNNKIYEDYVEILIEHDFEVKTLRKEYKETPSCQMIGSMCFSKNILTFLFVVFAGYLLFRAMIKKIASVLGIETLGKKNSN